MRGFWVDGCVLGGIFEEFGWWVGDLDRCLMISMG